ncbi:hypothetical protein GT037_008047 [Alternaria burnsii]|uniref:Uncharacterized protein n=1 Tax=Alternaria burnsii TaxID=1187904 RepID=A0A8H7B2T6_9PLEO|nr:uncharacterized protein GT037_008047 [Alternaria burnsii]KAF7674281.1 hypothetical protein GT037_008047 [Alternaria burnsii]
MEIRSAIMTTWTPMFDVNSSGPLLQTLGNGLDLPISGACPGGIGVFKPTNNESFLQSTTPHEPRHPKRVRSAPEQDVPCHSAQDTKQTR